MFYGYKAQQAENVLIARLFYAGIEDDINGLR
jgi:hypothetical protein